MNNRARILVIFKPEDELQDAQYIIDLVTPTGFKFVTNGNMSEQPEFMWLGFQWHGDGVLNEIEAKEKIRGRLPAMFADDACILFNPNPKGFKETTLTFQNGRFAEIRH